MLNFSAKEYMIGKALVKENRLNAEPVNDKEVVLPLGASGFLSGEAKLIKRGFYHEGRSGT
jgi:hypothetical protein